MAKVGLADREVCTARASRVGCPRKPVLDHSIPLVSDYKFLTAIGFVRAVLMPRESELLGITDPNVTKEINTDPSGIMQLPGRYWQLRVSPVDESGKSAPWRM
ncbi:unnamed protein product [Cylicostephanus goldi]|uniref:Uncharacterized protein n=1 Tax=Cylicostephanus goldi TaxID=71465 RepID=A0A3P7N8W9_CYLGO|nr:unnamed protein product [Cylicostephanus goldi]